MRKFCAGMFVVCYVVFTAIVYGATVEVSGKKLDCPKQTTGVFLCKDNGNDFLVVDGPMGFVAISKTADKSPKMVVVDKISDGERVLFEASPYHKKVTPDSKINRFNNAGSVIHTLKGVKLDLAKEIVKDAQDYILAARKEEKNVSITVGESENPYQCTRGETRPLTAEEEAGVRDGYAYQCSYYSCTQKGSDELTLAYLPLGNAFESPSIMSMKDGQAKYVTDDFKVKNPDGTAFLEVEKEVVDDSERGIIDSRLPLPDVDPDLFIPSKYDASKTSFSRMMELAASDFEQESTDLCPGDDIKKLFAEQKKIGLQMKDHLPEADLIEYLKMIDGNITSFYIDKTKGLELGCLYQGKVVDSSVLGNFKHLLDISTTKKPKKYLSVAEVQNLFKTAKNMKDIPFEYKYDGCYARAHIMARRFEKMGIAAQKVWIKGDLYVPGTDIQWNYHVAPVVEVKDAKGKIVKYVIDPSLTDKAVTVDEWVATMGKKTTGPVMKTTYPFPANSVNYQRTTVAISSAEPFAPMDLMAFTEKDKMDKATEVLKEYSAVLAESKRK